MRKFIDIIGAQKPESLLVLLEGMNYEDMFNPVWKFFNEAEKLLDDDRFARTIIENEIKRHIEFATTVLKRRERIVWYLRWARLFVTVNMLSPLAPKAFSEAVEAFLERLMAESQPKIDIDLDKNRIKRFEREFLKWKEDIKHYLDLPIHAIQEYRWRGQTPIRVLNDMLAIETEWKKANNALLPYQPEEILVSMPDNWFWVDLKKPGCKNEAGAMGHCGNGTGKTGQTVLSLRKLIRTDGGKKFWRPSLTFILEPDGFLGEMKGRENSKPKTEYHTMIMELLKLPLIKGIRGGGHKPENNFDLTDLTPEQRREVGDANPELMMPAQYFEKNGIDSKLVKMVVDGLRRIGFPHLGRHIVADTVDTGYIAIAQAVPWHSIGLYGGKGGVQIRTDIITELGEMADRHFADLMETMPSDDRLHFRRKWGTNSDNRNTASSLKEVGSAISRAARTVLDREMKFNETLTAIDHPLMAFDFNGQVAGVWVPIKKAVYFLEANRKFQSDHMACPELLDFSQRILDAMSADDFWAKIKPLVLRELLLDH